MGLGFFLVVLGAQGGQSSDKMAEGSLGPPKTPRQRATGAAPSSPGVGGTRVIIGVGGAQLIIRVGEVQLILGVGDAQLIISPGHCYSGSGGEGCSALQSGSISGLISARWGWEGKRGFSWALTFSSHLPVSGTGKGKFQQVLGAPSPCYKQGARTELPRPAHPCRLPRNTTSGSSAMLSLQAVFQILD